EAVIEYGSHGVKRMTWGELDATINRLGNALLARGVGASGRVALMLPNGSEYLIAHQALARIRPTAIHIRYHPKPAVIPHILSNGEPWAIIVHADQLGTLLAARAQVNQRGALIVVGDLASDTGRRSPDISEWDRALAAASPEPPAHAGGRGDGGGVIVYTSGT